MDRLLRVNDIVGCKKKGIKPILSMSKSSWWAGVASGKFPKPHKIGKRMTCWKESEIMAIIDSMN